MYVWTIGSPVCSVFLNVSLRTTHKEKMLMFKMEPKILPVKYQVGRSFLYSMWSKMYFNLYIYHLYQYISIRLTFLYYRWSWHWGYWGTSRGDLWGKVRHIVILNRKEDLNSFMLLLFDCLYSEENTVLDLDDHGGRTFLRVLLHLTMHDYPPLVSGALHLLFRHFSQRQEVLMAFKQVRTAIN